VKIRAKQALLPSGWAQDVIVEILDNGKIGMVEVEDNTGSMAETDVPILLAAPVNVHSHAFQRSMAGLTEQRGPDPKDTFWTWRRLMFRFLNQLTPDHVEAITAFVQMEMLEAGYATNVEFHYLHHQPGGACYNNIAEMSERVAAAALKSKIGLTLLPVHYQYGGCDRRSLGEGQIPFGNDLDRFATLFDGAGRAMKELPADSAIGVAPHSLRASHSDSLPTLIDLAGQRPIHMHLAEQLAEVDEVLAAWKHRPVEWLLDNVDVDERWCLVHCTQMMPSETIGLANTGAVAGLCPITEANLGDGIFDALRWFENGGGVAIGSDSNIRISLSEELRMLDYSQRLRDHSRAALAQPYKSTGRRLFDAILAGGAQAAGRETGRIEPGAWADLLALDGDAVNLCGRAGDTILDCFIFAGDDRLVKDVWSAGRHVVRDGAHIARDAISKHYCETMAELGAVM
jgi:formimidoylglutamate deiminase